MSYLDKEVMYYFRDELEKEAVIGTMAKGVGAVLKASAKGAQKGAETFGKLLSKGSTMGNQTRIKKLKDGTEELITNKDPTSLRHLFGAGALGIGTVHAGKGSFDTFKATRATQSQLPQAIRSGNVSLNMY